MAEDNDGLHVRIKAGDMGIDPDSLNRAQQSQTVTWVLDEILPERARHTIVNRLAAAGLPMDQVITYQLAG